MMIAVLLTTTVPWLQAQDGFDLLTPAPQPEQDTALPLTGLDDRSDGKPAGTRHLEKKLAETPALPQKGFIDAGDLRDPFFLTRGYREGSPRALEPGTTPDGVRFFDYSNLDRFVEKVYRESNFSLKDIFGRTEMAKGGQRCLICHRGIEEISKNHKFACTTCHSGNSRARSRQFAHKGLVSNPSSGEYAKQYCGKCHAGQIDKVERSLMATAKGEINLTRDAWGARLPKSPLLSLNPEETENLFPLESEDHPVNGFLRKKCLRCHLHAPGPHRPGDYRATGCAACHMIYSNDGLSVTRDRAIQAVQKARLQKGKNRFALNFARNSLNNKRGYPVQHKFTVAVPSVQCEHCHNTNGVGNEYEGLLAKPARPKPSMNKIDGNRPVLYGTQHDFLIPDIHREKGMHCIDCHNAGEIKAGGKSNPTLHESLETQCKDCHGTNDKGPEGFLLIASSPQSKKILNPLALNPNLANKVKLGDTVLVNSKGSKMPHIKKEGGQWVLISKVTGKKHKVPILKKKSAPVAHRIKRHMKAVECSACHARWSAAEWGNHFIYNEEADQDRWKDWKFSDPTLQSILSSDEIGHSGSMLDWLTAESSKSGINGTWENGVWWDLVTEVDPGILVLGKNSRGKYSTMKPRYQYFISKLPAFNNTDSKVKTLPITSTGKPGLIMVPYSPHTIRKFGRACEDCHSNPIAAGLGDPKRARITKATELLNALTTQGSVPPQFQLKQMVTPDGNPLQTTLFDKNFRFLNEREISALNNNSDRYRAYRYLGVRDRGFPRLLTREEFPFDVKHEENEKLFSRSDKDEDNFYDPNRNEFVGGGFEFEAPIKPEMQPTQDVLPEESGTDAPPIETDVKIFSNEPNGAVEFSPTP